jgi:hypothetical protein
MVVLNQRFEILRLQICRDVPEKIARVMSRIMLHIKEYFRPTAGVAVRRAACTAQVN